MKRRSRRQRLLASLSGLMLGLGLGLSSPAALAAENLVFVSGAFRRSIAVADLELLAKTGEARGLLIDVLRFSRQDPAEMARLLNQSISLPVTLVSRLLNTRIGEALLERLAQVVYPLRAPGVGLPALRSAVVMGLANNQGSISAISFLRAYPAQELEVNIPALLAVVQKASSVTELVRFFSESPLDGLRKNGDEPTP
ncbi:MAG: alpha/beta hydrolase [Cyanobacteria bacterium M_surface_10_m2_119]|nr:alpha/beta hydrolase [Cyanobacteria bacterium M_surface_10_m2_119]